MTTKAEPVEVSGEFVTLESLELEDSMEFIVRAPDGRSIRLQGHNEPWKIRLTRFAVPHVRAFVDKCKQQVEDGVISEEEMTTKVLVHVIEGWSNFVKPFSKSEAHALLNKTSFSWLRKFIHEKLASDRNFMKGISSDS